MAQMGRGGDFTKIFWSGLNWVIYLRCARISSSIVQEFTSSYKRDRYKNAVDENGRRQYEDMLSRADLGDLAALRADFKTSCQSKRNP